MTYFILIYCLFIGWTIFNSRFMPKIDEGLAQHDDLISILIPLRNEERNVPGLVQSLKELHDQNIEVLFLDDHSSDQTYNLLTELTKDRKNFHVRKGKPLPANWVGKVHACHQLSALAKGDYLFFIDADIRLQPTTIEHTLSLVKKRNASLLTGFPHFPTTSVLSKLLVPMQHFLVLFHLPLVMANLTRRPAFTAAHGAFMFFHHDAYKKIGGHKAVQSSLVEDVALAKEMKRSKETVILANITHEVSCYMYETNKEVWNGFAKNAFPGIGRSYLLALGISMFYITTFVSPLALAFIGLFTSQLLYVIPLLLIWTLKAYIDWTTNQKNGLFFLMPFSALMLVIMLHYSIFLALRKKGYEWKGRRYS